MKKNNPFLVSFDIIRKRKWLFLLQTTTTLVYIFLAILIIAIFSLSAYSNLSQIYGYIESIPLDDQSIRTLGDDPLQIIGNIHAVKVALLSMGILSLILAFLFGLVNWSITKIMIGKRDFVPFLKSYTLIFFSYMIPFAIFFYYTLKIPFQNALEGKTTPFFNIISWILLILLLYFFYISIALTTNTKLRDIPKKILANAKNLKITVPVFLFSIIFLIISNVLIAYFVEKSLIIVILMVLVMVSTLSYSRILYTSAFN